MQNNIWQAPQVVRLPGDWPAWLGKRLCQSEYKPAGRQPEYSATSQHWSGPWIIVKMHNTKVLFNSVTMPKSKIEAPNWSVTPP